MKRFLAGALALACLAAGLSGCGTTPAGAPGATASTPSASTQVASGQAILGATLAADTALTVLQTANQTGRLSAANCQVVANTLPDGVAALGAADVAWTAADATTLQARLADALQIVPILTGLAATPAASEIPTSAVAKQSTLTTIVALVPSLLSGVEDVAAVQAANTVPALQAAIPAAQSQLAADADDFGC
jgi:hypothetical protein